MKAAVFDIETTALAGVGAGILLVACVRPLQTQRTRTFRIDACEYKPTEEYGFLEREEKDLLEAVTDELSQYDLLIGHNIIKYDIPFLRTRTMRRGMRWAHMPFVYDTMTAFRRTKYLTVPNGFGKPSAGLDMVIDLFGEAQEKTKIYPVEWWESVWANKAKRTDVLDKITNHCQADVRMNAQIYPLLLAADVRANIRRAL